MKFVIKRYILFSILVLGSLKMKGQERSSRLYTVHDGLPQSQITTLFQDSRGYIWTGTQTGLAFFNGEKFQSILPKDGLPYPLVEQIQEDNLGNIWFTAGYFLCKYDGRNLSYDTFRVASKSFVFFIDNENTFWTINKKDSHIYTSKEGKNWQIYKDLPPSVKDSTWLEMVYDKTQNTLFCQATDKTIWRLFKGEWKILNKDKLDLSSFFSSGANNFDNLFFKKDSIFEYKNDTVLFVGKTNHLIRNVIRSRSQKLYLINRDEKVLDFFALDADFNARALGINQNINFVFKDKDQNLWLATEEGLMRLFDEGFINYAKKDLNGIWSMVEDAKGDMWFGSFGLKYLKKWDGLTFKEQPFANVSRSNDAYLSLNNEYKRFYFGGERDNLGNLYFPMSWGILKYDGGKFSRLDKPISNDAISMGFYLDKDRNTLVSGTSGGINIISTKNGDTKYYGRAKGVHPASYIVGITKDFKGNYWLGSSSGISCFNIEKDTVVKVFRPAKANFPYYGTTCMTTDFKGNIWAGSSQGLLFYDEKGDSFRLIAPQAINCTVFALKVLDAKYLVISAINGVYFLDLMAFYAHKKAEIVRCYNQHNGYMGIEPNQNCIYIDAKKNVWIAASDIVTQITPSALDTMHHFLKPYITHINDEPVLFENYGKIFHLEYGKNTAKIHFDAVGYQRPVATEYRYRMDNGEWSKWSKDAFAVLDNLSSQTYIVNLQTRPTGTVNDENIETASLQLVVDLPYHKYPNFGYGVMGIGALFSLFLVGLFGNYRDKIRQKAVEIAQRNELETAKKDRELKYLQIKTLQSQLNPHFIFNVLQTAKTSIGKGNEHESKEVIQKLAKLMRSFLESSVVNNLNRSQITYINLEEEIELLNLYVKFEKLQHDKTFDFTMTIDPNLDVPNIKITPMLLQPFVENAIKHGILYESERSCQLDIVFEALDNETMRCVISDTGVGRMRAQELQQERLKLYKSRGTDIVKERVQLMQEMGYFITVETTDNTPFGTKVTIEMTI
jgi:ligand-binding sensor domain-containing protein